MLPGADFCSRKFTVFDEVTCLGQLRCLGQFFSENSSLFFFHSHLSGAAALPGAELFNKYLFFFEEVTCPGQLRCLGQIFFQEFVFFREEFTCPGQLRCLGQNFFSDIRLLVRSHLSGAPRYLGQNCFSRNPFFLNTPLVWGSCAAWCRSFSQKQSAY